MTALLIGDIFGIIQSYISSEAGNFIFPIWAWWLILVVILIISPFWAFHQLRLKLENIQDELTRLQNARPSITVKPIQEQSVWYLLVTNNGAKGKFTAQLHLESDDVNVTNLSRLHYYQGYWDNPDGSNTEIAKGCSARLRIAVIESARPLLEMNMHLYYLPSPSNGQTIPASPLWFGATVTNTETGDVQPLPPPEDHHLLVTISAEPELREGIFQQWYKLNYNGLFLDTNYQPSSHKAGSQTE